MAQASIAELVNGITNATGNSDTTRIEHLESLTEKLSTPLSTFDVELLKKLKSTLLSGQMQAVNRDNSSELHAAKWKLFAKLLPVDGILENIFSEQDLLAILDLMLTDRHEASDVLIAMAQWLVKTKSNGALNIADLMAVEGSSLLDVIKQMYVTLGRPRLRLELAELLEMLVTTKNQAKQMVKSGMLRCFLQVALEQPGERVLLQNFDLLGIRVASFVCFGWTSAISTKRVESEAVLGNKKQRYVCELVVTLMLSDVPLVFADAVRMLQLLMENVAYRVLLPAVPDLRGSLEKAHTLVRLRNDIFSQNECLRNLCTSQYVLLNSEIDAYEREHGSVLGLPSHDDIGNCNKPGEAALTLALDYKLQGNVYFRRGNYVSAQVFYRRAIAVLQAAQLLEENLLRSLSGDKLLDRCSIGTSVQVCLLTKDEWHNAMVSDFKENDISSLIKVLYDAADREDEWVPISRIRLRMNTKLLALFNDLAVDCSMNMGKAFSALGDHDQAIQFFTHTLDLCGGKLIAALYSRGVAEMARRDFMAAQRDLWNANQQCRLQTKSCSRGGTSKVKTKDAEQLRALHTKIAAAYKKLKQMHATKKKSLDKKVIKQMVKYLSTIPKLNDQ